MKYLLMFILILMNSTAFASEICVLQDTRDAVENFTAYARTRESQVIRCTDSQLLEALTEKKLLVKYTWGYDGSKVDYTSFGVRDGDHFLFLQKTLFENGYRQSACNGQYVKY